ncbi:MAG TPA: hypothetical protein VH593_32910, partial [Ktedonobacteraceae bacterium]
MEQRSIQRTRRRPARQTRMSDPDVFEEEYDDIWPTRMPSSVRRYYSDDEGGGDNRARADVQPYTTNEFPTTRPARKRSVPARSTATQAEISPVRRTATQGRTPAVQMRRASTRGDVPAAQTRHATTQSRIPAARGRRVDTLTAQTRQPNNTDNITTRNIHTTRNHSRRQFHWLFNLGLVLLTMTLVWGILNAVSSWWQITANDWQYGRPRTYQTDQVVGHNDSAQHPSHFIALNLNGHIEVIEFPGGDPTKAKIYIGPVLKGAGQDLTP